MSNLKTVLIDFDKLKVPNCGLGNVAINFGNALFSIDQNKFKWEILVSAPLSVSYLEENTFKVRKLSILNKKNILPFDKGVDLVHLTNQMTKYRVSKGVKNILTIHDLNFLFEEEGINKKKKLYYLQKQVNRASLITVISEFTAKIVRRYLIIPENLEIVVVPNGVHSPMEIEQKKPNHIKKHQKFFFTIGTIMPKKNFLSLVEMMPNIEEETHLYIAGSFSKEEYVIKIKNRIQELKLENRVTLLGEITENEKSYLYQYAEAFLFPSLYEGFGLPIIEAMYCGTPVICSNLTSLPEIGGDYAYYWDNFEPNYMAIKVLESLQIFESNTIQNTSKLKKYAKKFSWSKNANKYYQLYELLIKKNEL
ncbi:glycosyltransferase family 1 protein [Flammeovirga pectinis]|uniref:Glycosyltransferase family 1 protein n=1 Tax=Flammeovirga pectinis TaxID=2494373 RepID=A0A3Q9FRF3_9BACT|nr:glycosyltransferase family 1 protein [Flammeovirga pectinis]AZQ63515.1 glycosyltransferase family 1 protein [Flammeovirga pectinis]